VLGLIDITVVANLWTPAVTGGYATFVSKLNLEGHADWLDWLSHVDPGTIKVKLAALLIGISSVHLLQAFVDVAKEIPDHIKWKVFIHMSFLGSAILLALTDKIIRIRNTEWGIRMNTACILFDGPVHALFPVQTSFERFSSIHPRNHCRHARCFYISSCGHSDWEICSQFCPRPWVLAKLPGWVASAGGLAGLFTLLFGFSAKTDASPAPEQSV